MKEAEANEQHKSIISALIAAAPNCEFQQIKFLVGNRGSVVESDFYTKLKKLDVQEGKKNSSPIIGMQSARSGDCPSSSRCKHLRDQPQRD